MGVHLLWIYDARPYIIGLQKFCLWSSGFFEPSFIYTWSSRNEKQRFLVSLCPGWGLWYLEGSKQTWNILEGSGRSIGHLTQPRFYQISCLHKFPLHAEKGELAPCSLFIHPVVHVQIQLCLCTKSMNNVINEYGLQWVINVAISWATHTSAWLGTTNLETSLIC